MIDVTPFTALLRDTIGLDAASVGVLTIERAVRERLVASRMEARQYLEHLRRSKVEMQELVEAVVVPETWFFRDREAFGFLARIVKDEWLRASPDRLLRMLSLPCATGEEPYSVAMALLAAGVPIAQFQIDAVDISDRALATAERAVYGRNAFRGVDQAFRDRYFTETPAGAQLDDAVRRQVRFRQGNLISPEVFPGTATYDAVFCRNLLIYFDRETQDRSIRLLEQLLHVDGVLLVGPSEAALMLEYGFVSARVPLAFAFRKVAPSPPGLISRAPRPARRVPPLSRRLPQGNANSAVRSATSPPPPLGLEEAAQLADQGRLTEAAAVCDAYIHRNATSVQAFYLMGLIHDAGGNLLEAERLYRKALYLDQDHQEALTHLALLLERQGKLNRARLLRDRAKRVGHR